MLYKTIKGHKLPALKTDYDCKINIRIERMERSKSGCNSAVAGGELVFQAGRRAKAFVVGN